MNTEEAIDLALLLLQKEAALWNGQIQDAEKMGDQEEYIKMATHRRDRHRDAWNTLEALRTEQAQARLVAQDPANQARKPC